MSSMMTFAQRCDVIGDDFTIGAGDVNSDDMATRRAAPRRAAYHHGDLANALVDAAAELVRLRGVDAFSLREAARNVGVDVAAVYRHFADKDDLLAAVSRRGFSAMAAQMERAEQGIDDARERFRALGRAYIRFAIGNPAYFRVMFGRFGAGANAARVTSGTAERGRTPYELLVDVLEDLARDRALITPVAAAAMAAWSAVHGLASLMVDGAWKAHPGATRESAIEGVLDMVTAGLIREGEACSQARG